MFMRWKIWHRFLMVTTIVFHCKTLMQVMQKMLVSSCVLKSLRNSFKLVMTLKQYWLQLECHRWRTQVFLQVSCNLLHRLTHLILHLLMMSAKFATSSHI